MTDPLDALSRLRHRVDEVLHSQGLVPVSVTIVPGEGDLELHLVVAAAEEAPTAEVDDEFDAVLLSAKQAEIEQRSVTAQEALRRTLDTGGGFLPPPAPPSEE